MTLSEFLLARIAEDEKSTNRRDNARRQIVTEHNARHQDTALMLGPNTLRQREWSGLLLAVQFLAAVYSNHPDYRQEWKP